MPHGELVALLGPSGCGKTTLLRIIAGLEFADSGEIKFDGSSVETLKPAKRKVGFVFQHYALFRHMSVFENISFGLQIKKKKERPAPEEIAREVNNLLQLVQLDRLGDRYPHELSGGQRQRVALARALAVKPQVLLLDEPFGALDAKVRKDLRRWLRKLHDEMHITSLFVTHDQEEALEVSDKVVLMNSGKIEQYASPEEVYRNPASPFVFHFLGTVNLFHARPQAEGTQENNRASTAYVRPHEIEIDIQPLEPNNPVAEIVFLQATGPVARLEIKDLLSAQVIDVEMNTDRIRELGIKKGSNVYYRVKNMKFFEEDFVI
ncbi:MAG: TOBE-like domain-containing protein [Leptospiraceae bacterium]|nr:TOBE-like domain-containing protein [Leptospiraceae bacterium]